MEQSLKHKLLIPLILVFLVAAVIPGIRLVYFAIQPAHPDSKQSQLIEIRKGENPNQIAKTLVTKGVVSEGRSLILLGRITRQWKRIKAGEYLVSEAMTPFEIFEILTSGISVSHPVTVREGENIYEIADDLAAKGLVTQVQFIKLCNDAQLIRSIAEFGGELPTTLEGYFFPDTYFFNRSMSGVDMAREMTQHFFEHWKPEYEKRARELKMTRHQTIILASMIEKETGAPEERPLISSVFHNRLARRMKLQSDPTTIYGIWSRYKGKIHKSDLFERNPYNTYVVEALPIGPIGNPGESSIHAALYPAQSEYFYFVSHNDGTHQFSKTIYEHNRAVQKFQLDPKARAGKSWRDHLKKNIHGE